ncbi:hypothetical protein [Nostoc sp.]
MTTPLNDDVCIVGASRFGRLPCEDSARYAKRSEVWGCTNFRPPARTL